MEIKQYQAAMEAILFASGEPVALTRIAEVLELDEETAELRQAVEAGQPVDSPHGIREELGDALFILCKIAQMSGVDPEDALHRACDKYQGRFRRVADAADRPLNAYTEAEKIALWEQAKEN